MRKILLSMVLFCVAFSLSAYSYVFDEAGLFGPDECSQVETLLAEASQRTGFPVVFVSTMDHGDMTMEAYADLRLEDLGYGDSGILLALDMGSRYYHITTMGSAIHVYTDSLLKAMADDFVPYLSSGRYVTAVRYFAEDAVRCFEKADSQDEVYEESGFPMGLVVLPALLGLFVSLIWLGRMKKDMKSAALVDNANDFVEPGSFVLLENDDIFLYSNVSKVRIEKSSGSSTHHSSSGVSHGGRGGRF